MGSRTANGWSSHSERGLRPRIRGGHSGGSSETPLKVIILTLALLVAPPRADAQPAGKVYRIGILGDKASDANEIRLWQTFRAGLAERGWNEGVNIRIEYRWVEGNAARLPELAADLVRLKPDVLATRGSLFTGALKTATSSIPIVVVAHADPVGTGHVASLARPGGNITGMAVLQTELGPKGLASWPLRTGCRRWYYPNHEDTWRHATVYVDKILRGARPEPQDRQGARPHDPTIGPAARG